MWELGLTQRYGEGRTAKGRGSMRLARRVRYHPTLAASQYGLTVAVGQLSETQGNGPTAVGITERHHR